MTARKLVQVIIGATVFAVEAILFGAEMKKVMVTVHTTRQAKATLKRGKGRPTKGTDTVPQSKPYYNQIT